jgi:DNA-binding NarL/FixJ family response regulator
MGLQGLIDNERNYQIVDCADEAVVMTELDRMPVSLLIINDVKVGENLKEFIATLRTKYSGLPILLIADTTDASAVLKTIDSGITGFLTKECDGDEIIHAIHSLIKGERFFCNNVLNILLNKDLIEEEDCSPTSITEREVEIIQEISLGLTSKQIGEKLHISTHTVQTHRKNIMRKLQVGSVSELILYAIRSGLVAASD